MSSKNEQAKFAFFYMLSLVALLFMSLSSGMIIFQIINKYVVDILHNYNDFSMEQLKFAISAIIISTPIYYFTTRQILRNLHEGKLDKDSGIRKWLTYFILLVSSVVMIGWMIGIINSFLDGELTMKFILKAVTAIAIAGIVFSYYLYDIRREDVEKRSKIIMIYFFTSLVLILAVFITSLFIVESPRETRNRKIDNLILEDFTEIDRAVNDYYREFNELPEDLDIIQEEFNYINSDDLEDSIHNKRYEYKVTGDRSYEICASFLTSNIKDGSIYQYNYYGEEWEHESGYQCIKQKLYNTDNTEKPIPARY